MKIEKILKQYYREKVEGFSQRDEIKNLIFSRSDVKTGSGRAGLFQSLVFHGVLLALLGILIWKGSGASDAFRSIDPENVQIERVDKAIRKGLNALWASVMPGIAPPDKGGRQ